MKSMHDLQRAIPDCSRCPRLRTYCAGIAETKVRRYSEQTYWGRPVPGFGDPAARLYILGLAPGAHGANRTGRMFTGDDSGLWLYRELHRFGFANQPTSSDRDDGLELRGAFIGTAARCAPPDNKPLPAELQNCRPFLAAELALLPELKVVLALGKIAFDAYLRVRREQGCEMGRPSFAHGAAYHYEGQPTLLCSFHPSRQNTNTGKLTQPMWSAIFDRARQLIDH